MLSSITNNTPLGNLWWGFKVATGYTADVLSVLCCGLSILCFTANVIPLGVILGVYAAGLYAFHKNLAFTMALEERRLKFNKIDEGD